MKVKFHNEILIYSFKKRMFCNFLKKKKITKSIAFCFLNIIFNNIYAQFRRYIFKNADALQIIKRIVNNLYTRIHKLLLLSFVEIRFTVGIYL